MTFESLALIAIFDTHGNRAWLILDAQANAEQNTSEEPQAGWKAVVGRVDFGVLRQSRAESLL